MTLDQVWFRLCDIKVLKGEIGERSTRVSTTEAKGRLKTQKDGMVLGRAADGTLICGRIRGKSRARELMEAEEKKRGN